MVSERRKKRLRKRNRNIFIISAILLVSLLGYYAVNNQFIRGLYYRNSSSVSESNVKIDVDTGVVSKYTISDNMLFSYSKNGISVYDISGNQINLNEFQSISHILSDFNNPILITCENYMLAFDKMGKSLITFNQKEVIHNIKLEYNIIMAKPLKSGGFLVITEDAGAKNQLMVYNSNAQKIFVWHSGVGNILDASMSNDENKLAVLSIDLSEGIINSKLLFFHINEAEPYAQKGLEDVFVTNISHYNNSNVIAISDSGVYYFKDNAEITSQYSYNDRLLSTYKILENGSIALSFKKNSSSEVAVEIINNSSKLKGSYKTFDEILFIDYKNKNILLCQKRKIDIISKSAYLIRSIDYNKDLNKAYFIGKNKMVLIGNSDVRIIN